MHTCRIFCELFYYYLISKLNMARGYELDDIRRKIIDLLQTIPSGLSGVEVAKRLDMNRITTVKYLSMLSTEGMIVQRNVGNVTIWLSAPGITNFDFPADYQKACTLFQDHVLNCSFDDVRGLIKSCVHEGASILNIMTEIIIPCSETIKTLALDGKIGYTEEALFVNMIIDSIKMTEQSLPNTDVNKNICLLATDTFGLILAESSATVLRSMGWNVFLIGDISSELLLELDLRKLLSNIWSQRQGIMIISGFSDDDDGLVFLDKIVNSTRTEAWSDVRFTVCSSANQHKPKADLVVESLGSLIQWIDTISLNK